jgi:hypothetical protein
MTQMINNVKKQIYTAGNEGPPSYKMPAMACEAKEKVENTQNVGSLEMRTKYFPNTSLQQNVSLLPLPQMGQILKKTSIGHFYLAYCADILTDVLSKSLELAFANPIGCVI